MEFRKQTYRNDNYRVIIDEPEDYAFECAKCGDPYFLALSLRVFETGVNGKERELGYYFREFDKEPNVAHVTRFIDKFLANKEYRRQYFESGKEWEGVILPNPGDKSAVNPRCAKAIKSLNERNVSKLRFKDFAALKTFGIDGFSRMKKETLAEHIGVDAVETVNAELDDDKLRLAAYRWVARVLKLQHAIRKVKTDAEIANNAKGAW